MSVKKKQSPLMTAYYFILSPVDFIDIEYLNIIASVPVLGKAVQWLPGVDAMSFAAMTWKQRFWFLIFCLDTIPDSIISAGLPIDVIPLDLEWVRFAAGLPLLSNYIGDPFEGAYKSSGEGSSGKSSGSSGGSSGLMPSFFDKTAGKTELKVHEQDPVNDIDQYVVLVREQDGSWHKKDGSNINSNHIFRESSSRLGLEFYRGEDGKTYMDPNTRRGLQDEGVLSGGSGGGSGGSGGGGDGHDFGAFVTWGRRAAIFGVVAALGIFLMSGTALGEYVGFGTSRAANQYGGSIDTSEQEMALTQLVKKGQCYLKGPDCFKQWQLNNTVRPGSNDVGEEYGLKIKNLEIGQGKAVDVAYKDGTYQVPFSFSLYNTRYGLKGINALNVQYRMRVEDSKHKGENALCDTGWKDITGYAIDEVGENNDLYPGTSASTGFIKLKDFSLANCNMMQPGTGTYKDVTLAVKYDYFSQATLQFRAMSRQTLESDSSISQEWKNSKTADTPVQAAINVREPVLFDQDTNPPRAQPFGVRATLNTDKAKLRYRVNNMEIVKSSATEVAKSYEDDCQFNVNERNSMELTSGAKKEIIFGADPSRDQSFYWFSAARQPTIFGCTMQLENPSRISPSGETLMMRVKSNYTVMLLEPIDSFKVYNSLCSRYNCPLLVTQQWKENLPHEQEEGWMSVCDGSDAGNSGCEIVDGKKLLEGEVDITNNGYDDTIDDGDVAISAGSKFVNNSGDVMPENASFGLKVDNWEKLQGLYDSGGYALIQFTNRDGENEIEFRELSKTVCPSGVDKYKSEKREDWGGNDVKFVVFAPRMHSRQTCEMYEQYEQYSGIGSP